MELVADGLTVRTPRPTDAAAVVDAVHSSLAELMPWMVWASAAYDVETALRWMRGDFGDAHPFLMIDGDGACVGTCGLNAVDDLNRRANLGYWVRSDRTGRGHATVATRLVARFGLEEAGLHRLEIIMSTRNERSRRVAERAGARHEGIARGRLLLHGEYHDAHLYSLLPGDLD